MDTGLVKLPISLGIKVNKILQEKIQFTPRTNKMGLLSFEFTIDELSLIDRLSFDNPVQGGIEGVELLPNLKSLIIKSVGNTAYTQDKYVNSISNKDGSYIAKCKNLEELDIENQAKLSFIDVSQMKRLHFLSVKRNAGLEEIYGLDSLEELWQLDCFGNESLTQIEGLNTTIMQNEELRDLKLDVLLFPDAIAYDHKTGKFNEAITKKFDEMNISWHEILSNGKSIKINNYQMMNMHKTAITVLEDYVPKDSDNRTTVIGIEEYLAENVKYDDESLNSRHSHISKSDKFPPMQVGPSGGANGAYNAFKYNTCVCEGYTRAMQYLLRLKGIKSHNVHCISGKDILHMSTDKGTDIHKTFDLPDDGYHSIISIDGVDCLYDDPCWNAGRYQRGDKTMPWTLLTKEEISKDHTLSFNERNIDNNTLKVSRYTIQTAIQKIAKYREERKRDKSKFSEEEIGKATINTPTVDKENAKERQERDENQINQEEQKNVNELK